MSAFTRVTVIGSSRKATLVLPSDEPVGIHLPDIGALLDEPRAAVESGPLTLVTPLGRELDLEATFAEQTVLDGNVLRLVRVTDVPPPPEVTDVTDAVADLRDTIRHEWSSAHRVLVAAITMAILVAITTAYLHSVTGWAAAPVFAALVIAAAALDMMGRRDAGAIATGGAVGAALPLASICADSLAAGGPSSVTVVALLPGFVWLALGIGIGIGQRSMAALIGAGTGVTLSAFVLALTLTGVSATHTAAIVGVLTVAVLGMLPTIALAISGTTALDDKVIAGLLPDRTLVESTVANAYRVFGWAAYAVAFWLAVAGYRLLTQDDIWAVLLGAAITVVTLLRTRIMPSAIHAWPLWAAGILAAIAGVAFSALMPDWMQITAFGLGLVAVAALALVRPSVHGRVRLRRLGDQLETLAAISLIPTVLGVFGLYAFMLGVFA